MKRILLFTLVFVTVLFFACQKSNPTENSNNLTYIGTTPGGCAVDGDNHSSRNFETDTVIWNISNDSLTIFVGFLNECCLNFKTESNISNDTIYMNIIWISGPACNCVCYYTYEFLFTGIDHPYYYDVNLFDYKHFTGYIKP
jgi:hypothetical protein